MSGRLQRIVVSLISLLCALGANADDIVEAVWKPQRAAFVYVGQTTFYTCTALEQKLTLVLQVLGAQDIEFDRRGCKRGGTTRLQVTFKSPVEATDENLRALTTYDSKQKIIARLNGVELPSPADLARFPASWQEVSFRDRRLRMSAADCEFIEHVRRQLVPHLSAQVITNRVFCTPGAHAIEPPRFVVSTLIASSR